MYTVRRKYTAESRLCIVYRWCYKLMSSRSNSSISTFQTWTKVNKKKCTMTTRTGLITMITIVNYTKYSPLHLSSCHLSGFAFLYLRSTTQVLKLILFNFICLIIITSSVLHNDKNNLYSLYYNFLHFQRAKTGQVKRKRIYIVFDHCTRRKNMYIVHLQNYYFFALTRSKSKYICV